jgi:hypothetical protein
LFLLVPSSVVRPLSMTMSEQIHFNTPGPALIAHNYFQLRLAELRYACVLSALLCRLPSKSRSSLCQLPACLQCLVAPPEEIPPRVAARFHAGYAPANVANLADQLRLRPPILHPNSFALPPKVPAQLGRAPQCDSNVPIGGSWICQSDHGPHDPCRLTSGTCPSRSPGHRPTAVPGRPLHRPSCPGNGHIVAGIPNVNDHRRAIGGQPHPYNRNNGQIRSDFRPLGRLYRIGGQFTTATAPETSPSSRFP